MKIGIIGKGNVAACLGPRWGACGHVITYGVRDPNHPDVKSLVQRSGTEASAVELRELSQYVDQILLSVRWSDISEVMRNLGELSGKILIDCITPMDKAKKRLLVDQDTSAAEKIAAMAPGATVVKAFDTAGVRTMENPVYKGIRATIFVCSDDFHAKRAVSILAQELGFDVCDAGNLEAARYLESVAMLWVRLAFTENYGEDIGFKLLVR